MLTCVNPLCGELPTGEPYAGDPHVRFGGRGDRDQTGLSYAYLFQRQTLVIQAVSNQPIHLVSMFPQSMVPSNMTNREGPRIG
jgi:hypothetical protein